MKSISKKPVNVARKITSMIIQIKCSISPFPKSLRGQEAANNLPLLILAPRLGGKRGGATYSRHGCSEINLVYELVATSH